MQGQEPYMKHELKRAVPIAETFAKLLHPFAEVVIHDLKKDKVEAIFNPLSGREVGDSSYLDRWDFTVDPDENIIGPYEKINYDGRRLKSISLVLRNEKKKAVGFLCVNMDISIFETYRDTLDIFLSNNDDTISETKKTLFKDDLYEQINMFIQNYCRERHLSLKALTRKDKQSLILKLREKGAFNGKNATSYIARILTISRASVYNYIKEKG
jgi:D-arginine utilization repressor